MLRPLGARHKSEGPAESPGKQANRQVGEKRWAAEERRWKTEPLSAWIRVYRWPEMGFSHSAALLQFPASAADQHTVDGGCGRQTRRPQASPRFAGKAGRATTGSHRGSQVGMRLHPTHGTRRAAPSATRIPPPIQVRLKPLKSLANASAVQIRRSLSRASAPVGLGPQAVPQ